MVFPHKYNSPLKFCVCTVETWLIQIFRQTQTRVIQIEQCSLREYSRICGEYKGNFIVWLNLHYIIILITSVSDFLVLVYSQLYFLVPDTSFFQISSFSFFSQSSEIQFQYCLSHAFNRSLGNDCLTLKSPPKLKIPLLQ